MSPSEIIVAKREDNNRAENHNAPVHVFWFRMRGLGKEHQNTSKKEESNCDPIHKNSIPTQRETRPGEGLRLKASVSDAGNGNGV